MVTGIVIALAVVGVTIFVLPHHYGNSPEQRKQSLLSNVLEFTREAPTLSLRTALTGGLLMFGCVAPLVPAPLLLLANHAGADRPVVLIVGGLLLVVAAAGTFIIVIVSELSYSLGSPSTMSGRCVNTVLVWLFPALCGLTAIVLAFVG